MGLRFWSELTGILPISSDWPQRYAYLGHEDEFTWKHTLILHRVRTPKPVGTNRSHVDITVDDLDVAIGQIAAIGGRLKRAPSIYPRPHSYPGEPPVIDWAVMRDPFGNEFCLVRVLLPAEAAAVALAGEEGTGDDDHWRDVSRRARGLARPRPIRSNYEETTMAIPITEMPVELSAGGLVTRYVEYGDMAIRHARVPAGGDMAPLLKGLPDDRCPSPHWGIVLDGSITVTHSDGTQETVKGGEVYYWPEGHTGVTEHGVTFLEVGPAGPMREFAVNAKRILGA